MTGENPVTVRDDRARQTMQAIDGIKGLGNSRSNKGMSQWDEVPILSKSATTKMQL